MKILSTIVPCLGEDSASWRMINIAKLLKDNDHDIRIVQYYLKLPDRNPVSKPPDLQGITISMFKTSFFTVHWKHRQVQSKDKYDLVYGNTHAGTFSTILGKFKGVPLIMDMHGGLYEEYVLNNPDWKKSPKRIMLYQLYKLIDWIDIHAADKILCPSHKMMQYLHSEKGVPIQKIVYVTNGVDLDYFQNKKDGQSEALRKKLGLEGKLVFGYIGASDKWQGFENFEGAAGLVQDSRIAFIFVGGGEAKKEGNRIYIARQPRDKILNYYSLCDVLVLPRPSYPATEIAAPTKFAEYTSMSKPVLTTEVGDAADLVKKYKCGIVVADNSPENLAQGVREFNQKAADEFEVMGRNSRTLAENEFDWNKVAVNLYQAVADVKR